MTIFKKVKKLHKADQEKFNEGYEARKNNIKFESNPYPITSHFHYSWNLGWTSAHAVLDETDKVDMF